jgi:hypothetical protein
LNLFDEHLVEEEVVSDKVSVVFETFWEGVDDEIGYSLPREVFCIDRWRRWSDELEEVEQIISFLGKATRYCRRSIYTKSCFSCILHKAFELFFADWGERFEFEWVAMETSYSVEESLLESIDHVRLVSSAWCDIDIRY